jgi:hypothetical protein
MTLRDWILFIFTFIVGLFAGLYLYYTTFVPEYVENRQLEELMDARRTDLQVIGEQYGGCERLGCASFQLTGDRQYRYQAGYVRNTAENIETGDLPRTLFSTVKAALDATDLSAAASPAQRTCQSWSDGVDVRYRIAYGEDEYILDSCTTQFSERSPLGLVLADVFAYLDDPNTYQPAAGSDSGSVGEYVEGVLEENFQR